MTSGRNRNSGNVGCVGINLETKVAKEEVVEVNTNIEDEAKLQLKTKTNKCLKKDEKDNENKKAIKCEQLGVESKSERKILKIQSISGKTTVKKDSGNKQKRNKTNIGTKPNQRINLIQMQVKEMIKMIEQIPKKESVINKNLEIVSFGSVFEKLLKQSR